MLIVGMFGCYRPSHGASGFLLLLVRGLLLQMVIVSHPLGDMFPYGQSPEVGL